MKANQSEIIALEKKYWDAMKADDIEGAVAMTKFPCTISGPQGVKRVSEKDYRKMMGSMKGENYEGMEILEPQVDVLNQDAALISYSTEHNGMKMLDVSTWIRENGKWVCAFHSENPLTDKNKML